MPYVVIENTPGYLPDSYDPFETEAYHTAVAYANELADELEEQGWECDRSWASQDNYYAIRCVKPETVSGQPRVIEVVRLHPDYTTGSPAHISHHVY